MNLLFRQFMLFTGVGAVGTAAHFGVLIALVRSQLAGPVVGSVCGFAVGAVVNYLLNYHLTFASTGRHLPTFLKFFSVALSGLCLNTLIMFLATTHLHYLLSQMMATGTVLIWNFICNRFWTFREVRLVRQP